MEIIDNIKLEELADSYLIQKNQRQSADSVIFQVKNELETLESINAAGNDELDRLLLEAQALADSLGYSESDVTEQDYAAGEELLKLNDEEKEQISAPYFDVLATVDESGSWEDYMNSISDYAVKNNIDLTKDPFDSLLTETEKNEIGQRIRDDYLMQKAHCDKYDYIIAAFCGVACGLIDSFFVRCPSGNVSEETKLAQWTDKMADNFVSNISQKLWNVDSKERNRIMDLFNNKSITKDQRDQMLKAAGIPYNQALKSRPDSLQQCIQYLEKKFGVNYDAPSAASLNSNGALSGMRPSNHHMMSLGHSPSLIGLLFSIVDQFTGKASFVDKGKLIRLVPKEKANDIDSFELRGSTFVTKLICGFVNWLGHLISDLVGSNTTRISGSDSRGSGLPVPFLQFLQLCTFKIPDGNGKTTTISELALDIFNGGYDLRFAATTAIPVIINEFLVRLLWALKSRFYHKRDWSESIPFGNKPELRRMLLVSNGTLCAVDAIDAGIRSVDMITFAMHLNVTAWLRLGISGLQEIRALYKENVMDLDAVDNDLNAEWAKLYEEISG